MAPTIRLVDWADGSIIDTVTALEGTEFTHELGQASEASLRAERAAIEPLDLAIGDDEVYCNSDVLGDEFGGRLVNVIWRGEQAVLIGNSFERDAEDAEPAGDGTGAWHYENVDDATIVRDAIGRVGSLSEGTVETVETGLSFRFSRVSQAKILRTVEETGDGELFYHPDGSVDYVDSLGRDRTHDTLGERGHRLFGDFDVERAGDDRKINRLVMLGSGEGPGQVTTTVTASGFDPGTDREKWGVRRNSEFSDTDTLDTVGQPLVDEFAADYLDATTGVRNETIDLGDEFHVAYPSKNVDDDLRAARVTTQFGQDGRTHRVTFSNRSKTRESLDDEIIKDVRRGGRVINGFTVPLSVSSGPAAVSPNLDHRFSIPYPSDVLQEIKVDLRIRGLQEYDDDMDAITGDYPANVTVKVNGAALPGVGPFGDGNGAFLETVDLTGELTEGQINTIDLTSDTKARVYAVLDAELYRTMAGS